MNPTTTAKEMEIARDSYRPFQKAFLPKYAQAKEVEFHKQVVGLDYVFDVFFAVIFGRGHMALQAPPGMGKTTAITAIAQTTNAQFRKVTFDPSMQPQDLGVVPIPAEEGTATALRWKIKDGPLFQAEIFFGNEFNRTPEKVQAALLSALEEYEFKYLGEMRPLHKFFVGIIDYNTLESAGTYGFSEAAFDRFMAAVEIPQYDFDTLCQIVATSERKKMDPASVEIKKVFTTDELLNAGRLLYLYFKKYEDPKSWLVRYVSQLLLSVRSDDRVERSPRDKEAAVGPSPRAAEDAKALSRFFAFIDGEDEIYPEHIKKAVRYSFFGKFFVKQGAISRGMTERTVIEDALRRVPIPGARS